MAQGCLVKPGFGATQHPKHPNQLLSRRKECVFANAHLPTPLRFLPDPIEELLVISGFFLREPEGDATGSEVLERTGLHSVVVRFVVNDDDLLLGHEENVAPFPRPVFPSVGGKGSGVEIRLRVVAELRGGLEEFQAGGN